LSIKSGVSTKGAAYGAMMQRHWFSASKDARHAGESAGVAFHAAKPHSKSAERYTEPPSVTWSRKKPASARPVMRADAATPPARIFAASASRWSHTV
jgi:hypothetical protein